MKILEYIFLIISTVSLVFFLILTIWKLKTSKRVKKTVFSTLLISFVLSSFAFGGLKIYDNHLAKEENRGTASEKDDNTPQEPSKEPDDVTEPNNSSTNNPSEPQKPSTNNNNNTKPNNPPANNSTTTNATTTSKGFKIEVINGITYVDGIMIANKTYPLPKDYVPPILINLLTGQVYVKSA